MLQNMQKKVEADGEKEKELYDKFMCYCENSGNNLGTSIAAAEEKIPSLEAKIKAGQGQSSQLKGDLVKAKSDREAANKAMEEAKAIRAKEAGEFAAVKAEAETNIASIGKGIAAMEKGAASSFLQTGDAATLKTTSMKADLIDTDREEVMSFLSGKSSSSSPEITGILKQMQETMSKGLAEATASEDDAISDFEGLMMAKKKEIASLTKAIETKMSKLGELSTAVAEMEADAEDTKEALAEDKKFLADLHNTCAHNQKNYEINKGIRGEELVALGDTIKLLNDDDALDLFKKTLPGSASSFLQVQVTTAELRARAMEVVKQGRENIKNKADRTNLDLLALALHGKKAGFDKVLGMIDNMVATLNTEQGNDDKKKAYCEEEFDLSDDKKKVLERSSSDADGVIADTKEGIGSAQGEMTALTTSIIMLDGAVAAATMQRKQENAEYKLLMSDNAAAKEVLAFAKNRLNKFYNPKLYKPMLVQTDGAPPPPPEAAGAYKKKAEDSTGVIEMISLLIKDLEKEMTEAKVTETEAQKDYESTMKDSAEKRAQDSKSLTEKSAAKADMEAELEQNMKVKKSVMKELQAVSKYIMSLHAECDWLVQYYTIRKEARTDEIESLGKAKDALSGADLSLMQTGTRHVRRHFLNRV